MRWIEILSWTRWIRKLLAWRHARDLFLSCFCLTLLFTFFLVAANTSSLAVRLQLDHPRTLLGGTMTVLDLVSLLGATLLWVGMLVHCWSVSARRATSRLLWSVILLFGAFWGACLYFLTSYLRREPEERNLRMTCWPGR